MKFIKTLLLATFALLAGNLSAGSFGGGGGTPPLVIIEEGSGGWSNVSHIFTDTQKVIDPETGGEKDVPLFPEVIVLPDEMARVLDEASKSSPISRVMVGDRVAYFHAIIVDVPNRRMHGNLFYEHNVIVDGELIPSVDAPIEINLVGSDHPLVLSAVEVDP